MRTLQLSASKARVFPLREVLGDIFIRRRHRRSGEVEWEMTNLKESIADVLSNIVAKGREDLIATPQSDLEKYWTFQWDSNRSNEWNLYQFTKSLELYKSFIRRWEEHHNGNCCVVERVRDVYLMPKIKAFVDAIAAAGKENSNG